MYGETVLSGYFFLACLDSCIKKLFKMSALQAHDMVVVFTVVQFKYRFPAFKMVAKQNAGQFKLGQNTVYRGNADILTAGKQQLVHILSS